jgi:hypothetical protein
LSHHHLAVHQIFRAAEADKTYFLNLIFHLILQGFQVIRLIVSYVGLAGLRYD